MDDLVGVNGNRKTFKIGGEPNLPGKLSLNITTGKS
jgi:hypothetical protein